MHAQTKKRILCRLPYIAENTGSVPKLLVQLIAKNVIEIRERDNILSHPSDYDKCVDLCTTLLGKNEQAYQHFLNALDESANTHVKEEILKPLDEQEEKRSIDELFYNLGATMKGSKAERKLQFYETLGKYNSLVFQQIGTPGLIGDHKIMANYYILNELKERLFHLSWDVTRIHHGMKPMFSIFKLCLDTPNAYTKPIRLCLNLTGETIMEIDTPVSIYDINVGNDFIGSVKGHYIRNAENQLIWRVKRQETLWKVYNYRHTSSKEPCAQFGFGCLRGSTGIIFKTPLSPDLKAILFGAAVIYMDKSLRGSKRLQKLMSHAPWLIPLAVIVVIIIVVLIQRASGASNNNNEDEIYPHTTYASTTTD